MFEDRSIDDIEDQEWNSLIMNGAREQQRLEFKATLRISQDKNQSDKEKLEMLIDIASMANAQGGYILYGVKEDGSSCSSGYFGLTREDAKKVENIIDEHCVVHICERIEGLEVRCREIQGNFVVIVRVPSSSKAPHMVTYTGANIFQIRHDDHKRKMTIGEIRAAFNDDTFGRRLARVEQELFQLLDYMKNSVKPQVSKTDILPEEDAERVNNFETVFRFRLV